MMARFTTLELVIFVGLFIAFWTIFIHPSMNIDSSTPQEIKKYVDSCEDTNKELIETQEELTDLKNIDIYRYYEDCKEDLRNEKSSLSLLDWFLGLIVGLFVGSVASWIISSEIKEGRKKK